MIKKRRFWAVAGFIFLIMLTVIFIGCMDIGFAWNEDEAIVNSVEEVPDVDMQKEHIAVQYKSERKSKLSNLNLTEDEVEAASSISKTIDVIELSDDVDAEEKVKELRKDADVAYAYVDIGHSLYETENSAVLADQAATVNGQTQIRDIPNDRWYDSTLFDAQKISRLWTHQDNSKNNEVTVAVIDSGCNPNHEDLTGIVTCKDMCTNLDGYEDTYAYAFHGTAVCSTIAANINNGIGVAGVSLDYPVKIISYRCGYYNADDKYIWDSCIKAALDDIIDEGICCAVNMSFGSTSSGNDYYNGIYKAFNQLYENGVVLVAAAGNESSTSYSYPASYDSVISVASVNKSLEQSSFSNANDQVEVAAIGEDVYVAAISSDDPENNATYYIVAGTSFSSPTVTALAAMLKSQDNTRTGQEIRQMIRDSAYGGGGFGVDTEFGEGVVRFDEFLCAPYIREVSSSQGFEYNSIESTQFTIDSNDVGENAEYRLIVDGMGTAEPVTYSSDSNVISFTPPDYGIYDLYFEIKMKDDTILRYPEASGETVSLKVGDGELESITAQMTDTAGNPIENNTIKQGESFKVSFVYTPNTALVYKTAPTFTYNENSFSYDPETGIFTVLTECATGSQVITAVLSPYPGENWQVQTTVQVQEVIKGDVDLDGQLTLADAELAKKAAMKDPDVSLTTEKKNAADLDSNGVITINEAREIKRKVLQAA